MAPHPTDLDSWHETLSLDGPVEPFLVFADWLQEQGDPRGELVLAQSLLESGTLARDAAVQHRRREAALIEAHGDAWAGLGDLATGYLFRRGFVAQAVVDARVFAARGEELFRAAPLLTRVQLAGLDDAPEEEILRRLAAVVDSPWFARVRGLRLREVGRWVETEMDTHPTDFESAGSAALQLLVKKKALKNLRSLEMPACCLSGSDVERLAKCADAKHLTTLDLRFQGVDRYVGLDSTDAVTIVESQNLAGLEELDLGGALGKAPDYGGTRAARAKANREQADRDADLLGNPRILALRKLGIATGAFSDKMIDAIATAPFTRLELLDISGNDVFEADLTRFGAAPGLAGLKELIFNGPCRYVFSAEMARALGGAARFDALRTLRLAKTYMKPEAAAILLASPLAKRLEVIDLRRNPDLVGADDWRRMFDGVLLLSKD